VVISRRPTRCFGMWFDRLVVFILVHLECCRCICSSIGRAHVNWIRDCAMKVYCKIEKCSDGRAAGLLGYGVYNKVCIASNFAVVRHRASISMVTAIAEVFHVDDKAQAGNRRRNSGSGIHGADRPYVERVGKGYGCAAQARQRIMQRPQGGNGPDCAHPCPRVWQ
jgi:hypothetical protein